MERFSGDLQEISSSDDIMAWSDAMDKPETDPEGHFQFTMAVIDHELPLYNAILRPFCMWAGPHSYELIVHVMSGAADYSFNLLFNLLDDLNSFTTRVFREMDMKGIFTEWWNTVHTQGCIPEDLQPVLDILPDFAGHLLPLINYLTRWPTGIMSVRCP
jgi:hypothetical protein